jgi:hypothetical protein
MTERERWDEEAGEREGREGREVEREEKKGGGREEREARGGKGQQYQQERRGEEEGGACSFFFLQAHNRGSLHAHVFLEPRKKITFFERRIR